MKKNEKKEKKEKKYYLIGESPGTNIMCVVWPVLARLDGKNEWLESPSLVSYFYGEGDMEEVTEAEAKVAYKRITKGKPWKECPIG